MYNLGMENKQSFLSKVEPHLPNEVEGGQPLRNAREAIFAKFEQKAEIASAAFNLIESIKPSDTAEGVEERFTDFLGNVKSQFPEVAKLADETNGLFFETAKIDRTIDKYLTGEGKISDDEFSEYQELSRKVSLLRKKMTNSLMSDDVRFLVRLEQGFESLNDKFVKVRSYENNRDLLMNDVDNALNPAKAKENEQKDVEKIKAMDKNFKKVSFDSFGVNFIVKKEYFDRIHQDRVNRLGFHVVGTPFNFIKEMEPESVEFITKHENVHNLYAGFTLGFVYPSKFFQGHIQRITSLEQKNADESIIKLAAMQLSNIIGSSETPNWIVGQLKEEMLADYDRVGLYSINNMYSALKEREYVGFHTAQAEIQKVSRLLDRIKNQTESQKLGLSCERLIIRMNASFDRATRYMRKALFISGLKRFDRSEILGLLTMLPPKKYHQIESYLSAKYKKDYEIAAMMYERQVRDFSMTAVKRLDDLKEVLFSKDLENVKREILQEDFSVFVEQAGLSGATIEKARNYLNQLISLNSKMNIEPEEMARVAGRFLWSYFFDWITKDIKNNFHNFTDLFGRINAEEKKFFLDALGDYSRGFLQEELNELNLDSSLPGIKNQPFWKVLQSLGIDQCVESGAIEHEKNLVGYARALNPTKKQ